jgi:hypothetical protein
MTLMVMTIVAMSLVVPRREARKSQRKRTLVKWRRVRRTRRMNRRSIIVIARRLCPRPSIMIHRSFHQASPSQRIETRALFPPNLWRRHWLK